MFILLPGEINFETTLDTVFHTRDWQRLGSLSHTVGVHRLQASSSHHPRGVHGHTPQRAHQLILSKYQMNVIPKLQFQEYI